jgi:hypothetical protein
MALIRETHQGRSPLDAVLAAASLLVAMTPANIPTVEPWLGWGRLAVLLALAALGWWRGARQWLFFWLGIGLVIALVHGMIQASQLVTGRATLTGASLLVVGLVAIVWLAAAAMLLTWIARRNLRGAALAIFAIAGFWMSVFLLDEVELASGVPQVTADAVHLAVILLWVSTLVAFFLLRSTRARLAVLAVGMVLGLVGESWAAAALVPGNTTPLAVFVLVGSGLVLLVAGPLLLAVALGARQAGGN